MRYYYGSDQYLFIEYDNEYLPVGCLTDNPLSEDAEFLPTTTREGAGWKTSRPTVQGYQINFTGLQILTGSTVGTSGVLSYDRLKALKRARTLLNWRIQTSDGSLVDSGAAYISAIGQAAPVDGWLTYDCSLTGFGEPVGLITEGDGSSTGGGSGLPGTNPIPGTDPLPAGINSNNRFRIIYFVDASNNVVSYQKTNDVDSWEVYGKSNNLFARIYEGDAVVVLREVKTVTYELSENQPDFLDLNIQLKNQFNGVVLANIFSEDADTLGAKGGQAYPLETQPMSAEILYYGGVIDPNGNPVAAWDSPVRVTFRVTKDGVTMHESIIDYQVPPAANSIGVYTWAPNYGEDWHVLATVERI